MSAASNAPVGAVLHALDLAMMQEWDHAKAILEPMDSAIAGRIFLLICQLEEQDEARSRAVSVVRHEIGNALAIAQANLEGIVDGVLDPSIERINGILASLSSAGALLDDLRRLPEAPRDDVMHVESFNVCVLIAAHAAAIAGLAEAKNVKVLYDPCAQKHVECIDYRGDRSRVGQVLRNILINAVRYTPPGGVVCVRCDRPGNELTLEVRDSGAGLGLLAVVRRLLNALGGDARVESSDRGGTVVVVRLPATRP